MLGYVYILYYCNNTTMCAMYLCQLREFWDLQPPRVVICQVEVELVDLVRRHKIQQLQNRRLLYEVTTDVQHHPPVLKAGGIRNVHPGKPVPFLLTGIWPGFLCEREKCLYGIERPWRFICCDLNGILAWIDGNVVCFGDGETGVLGKVHFSLTKSYNFRCCGVCCLQLKFF